MSEIRVDSITDEQGTGRPAFTNGVQTSNINGGQIGGRRNLIINGAMNVFQRAQTATNINSVGYYTADRARISFNGASGSSVDQEVLEDQSVDSKTVNVLKTITTTAASTSGGELGYNYRFEKQDLIHTQGNPITVSLYAKADSPIDIITYSIGSPGVTNEDIMSTPFTLSTEWQRYVGTVTLGSEHFDSSAEYIDFIFRVDATVETSVYVTMVQVEEGDTATEFEHRSIGEELALCQRYYYQLGPALGRFGVLGEAIASTLVQFNYVLPVKMRSSPSLLTDSNFSDYELYRGNQNESATQSPSFSSFLNPDGDCWGGRINLSLSSGFISAGQVTQGNGRNNAFFGFDAEL